MIDMKVLFAHNIILYYLNDFNTICKDYFTYK